MTLHHFRVTIIKTHNRNEMLAKIEVRQEAVQQALAALKNRPKPSLPMPSKRSSVFNRSPERGDEHDSEGNFFLTLSLNHDDFF
jgi:hypothetical protein